MLEGYKPTKAEASAIERGFRLLAEVARDSHRVEKCARDEKNGYGNASDRVPLAAARGMVCKWFLQGWKKPDMLLRRAYYRRPASIYMNGLGADLFEQASRPGDWLALAEAVSAAALAADAHEAAFARMQAALSGV